MIEQKSQLRLSSTTAYSKIRGDSSGRMSPEPPVGRNIPILKQSRSRMSKRMFGFFFCLFFLFFLTSFSCYGRLELHSITLTIQYQRLMKISYTIKQTGEKGIVMAGSYWEKDTEIPYTNEENAKMIHNSLLMGGPVDGFKNIYPEGEYDLEDVLNNIDADQFETSRISFENIFPNGKVIVVTRHQALIEYLHKTKIVNKRTCSEIEQVTDPRQIMGAHVIGVLPPYLAMYAHKITNVPMVVPAELRGVELTLEQVEQYAGKPFTYEVNPV